MKFTPPTSIACSNGSNRELTCCCLPCEDGRTEMNRESLVNRVNVAGLATLIAGALATSAIASPANVPGNPVAGKRLFLTNAYIRPCGSCHTLKAAGSYGDLGPNLDKVKPSYAKAIRVITNGVPPTARYRTGMSAFGDVFSKKQIQDLAAFIYISTHKLSR
jgi:mono/diheme cytochrome c family protein